MSKTKYFTIKNSQMLFWRLGNINSNVQKHYGKSGHQPPEKRGFWCFPYPHYDLFFCYHQWEQKLPKKYRHNIGEEKDYSFFDNMTDFEAEQYHKEKERLLKEIQKKNKPTKFWYGGKFYSHIPLVGETDYNEWFLWDNVKQWANIASKKIYHYERFEDKLYRFSYAKDHLEIFIPNF